MADFWGGGLMDAIYLGANGLVGRWWLLDTLIARAIDNNLVKAAPIGAAFLYAWNAAGGGEAGLRRRRGILLVTLASLVLVLGATKMVSKSVFLPRPLILSMQTYHIESDRLVEAGRLAYSPPMTGYVRGSYERLQEGEVIANDLASFPSDHAGFYFALALGIAFACRAAGLFALGWTLLVILFGRIATGMHSPLDIATGMAIGATVLIPAQLAFARWGGRLLDPLAGWTMRHSAVSSALLFVIIFEAANTLENLRPVLRTGKEIVVRAAGLG